MGPPARIVQSKGWIVFLYVTEPGNFARLIPTDGRAHRTDLDGSYNGDSVAHWEGDTLVVDETGFNDDTWLGSDGWFHSEAMHVSNALRGKGRRYATKSQWRIRKFLRSRGCGVRACCALNTNPSDEIYDAPYCNAVDADHIVNHDHF